MKSLNFKQSINAIKNFSICKCQEFFKKKYIASCKLKKQFWKEYSLHIKFIALNTFSNFFQKIDKFTKKHPIWMNIIILGIAFIFNLIIENRFNSQEPEKLEMLISKGFFIAPLLTLMVSNQKAIVNHFSAIFFYDKDHKDKDIDNQIDTEKIAHKEDITIREAMIEVIYTASPNQNIKDYIAFTKKMIENSIVAREGNAYKNTTALIFAGSALMIGFFMLLFGLYNIALTLLLYSLLIILAKEILGIRSIIKRTLFSKFIFKLIKEKDNISEEERRQMVFGS